MDKTNWKLKGRSNRIYNKPWFSNLLISALAAPSMVGYYGAAKHNKWNFYIRNTKVMGLAFLGTFILFTSLNYLYTVDVETLNAKSNDKPDFIQMKKDMERLGLIKDKTPKPN